MNLTLAIEEEILLEARKLALDRRTTVNQLVREYLVHFIESEGRRRLARQRLSIALETGVTDLRPDEWRRDALYERR